MEDFGMFYGHLVYCTAIWYILWSFGIFYGYLVYISHFGMLYVPRKSGNPVQIMPTAKSLWSGAYSTGLTVSHTRQSTQDE
jgi:hypothetical protein